MFFAGLNERPALFNLLFILLAEKADMDLQSDGRNQDSKWRNTRHQRVSSELSDIKAEQPDIRAEKADRKAEKIDINGEIHDIKPELSDMAGELPDI